MDLFLRSFRRSWGEKTVWTSIPCHFRSIQVSSVFQVSSVPLIGIWSSSFNFFTTMMMLLRNYYCCCLFLTALLRLSYAFAPLAASYSSRRSPRSSLRAGKNELSNTEPSPTSDEENTLRPRLIFPGGGLFFYWQAGVIVSRSHLICLSLVLGSS